MPMNTPRSEAARVFRALADDTRLEILAYLKVRELCVCEITELVGLSQASVSEHLRRLKDAGLVEDERRGTWSFYRLRYDLPAFADAALAVVELPPRANGRLPAELRAECGPTKDRLTPAHT